MANSHHPLDSDTQAAEESYVVDEGDHSDDDEKGEMLKRGKSHGAINRTTYGGSDKFNSEEKGVDRMHNYMLDDDTMVMGGGTSSKKSKVNVNSGGKQSKKSIYDDDEEDENDEEYYEKGER